VSGINKANQRQHTRHAARYLAYRNSERREVNKAIRIIKHLHRHPESQDAQKALANLGPRIEGMARKRMDANT